MPAPRRFRVLRYLFPMAMLGVAAALWLLDSRLGARSANMTLLSLEEMMLLIPPIFVILGLLDVWVPRETMVRFMGDGSGWKGVGLAFLLGSAAAGPLYGAFPVAQVLLRKGASLRNVLIFIGAWSTTKVPMLLFEAASMGPRFALTRLAVDLVGIAGIALLMDRLITEDDRREILGKAARADRP
jgi:uncharacterized membrane protein YraQ (UPF0718 family)